ncbi:MAG: lactonase family protein [Solobacterium sp.]|nr:lactonase family protein [Solobacterium sp.]
MKNLILSGTYNDHGSEGIYSFELTDGILQKPQVFSKIKSAKYIAVNGNRIASIGEFPNGCGVALIDENGNILDTIAYEERTSCYVVFHDDKIYTANYHLGQFTVLRAEKDRLRLINTVMIREKAGCHQVLFSQDKILIPCLFLDRVMIYSKDLVYQGAIRFPQGTGPRHGVFSADGTELYLVSELSNELFVFDTADFSLKYSMPVLPDGETHVRDTAAVRLSDDGKLLYVSTRTKDVLSVIDLSGRKLLQAHYCGGRHPRDFIIVQNHAVVANRFSDNVVSFELNEDGTLGKQTGTIIVPQAVSLAVLEKESTRESD